MELKSNSFSKDTVIRVKASSLNVDTRVQRAEDKARVAHMVKTWDARMLGVLVVSRRKDGSLWVVDGQHRLAALRELDLLDEHVLVRVFDCLSLKDEAELFLCLGDDCRPHHIRVYDKYQIGLRARRANFVEVNGIVESVGLKIGKSNAAKTVAAIQSLFAVHHNYSNLERVLRILEAWEGSDCLVYDGTIMQAVGAFLSACSDAKDSQLIKLLRCKSSADVLKAIKTNRKLLSASHTKYEADVATLVKVYNNGKGGSHRVRVAA
jgi:hypothetical protein